MFSSWILLPKYFFNDISHDYRAALLKKNSSWLLPFYIVVATYSCYEKVGRTMRTAIVSNLLKLFSYVSGQLKQFLEKDVMKTCSKFTGEHPWRSVISIQLLCNFIEIAFRHGWSPVTLQYIFRKPFYKNTYGGFLLGSRVGPCQISVEEFFRKNNQRLKTKIYPLYMFLLLLSTKLYLYSRSGF